MFKRVNLHDFREAFRTMDRTENFSQEGLEILFKYLEGYEDDAGAQIELDVVGLCCSYAEGHPSDIASEYRIDLGDGDEDDEAAKDAVIEYMNENTMVVGETASGTIVYEIF
jgi:hypothetical protein